jgi:hypothetical protein
VTRSRPLPSCLSDAERRVLEAFRCGHISAGRLSEALAHARAGATVTALAPRPVPADALRVAA